MEEIFQFEEWRPVVGFEGLYECSSLGRVRSVKHPVKRPFGDGFAGGKMLKQNPTDRGYLVVCLSKNGKHKCGRVHQLVAKAFIPNPHNLPYINHKDEDKSNNRVSNLEWCSPEYNTNYGTRNKKVSEKMTNGKLSKKVDRFDLNGNYIDTWISINEIQRVLGFHSGAICACCKGKRKAVGNFVFRYADNKKEIA